MNELDDLLPSFPSECRLPDHCQCECGHDAVDMIYNPLTDTFYCPVCEGICDAALFRIAVWEQLHGQKWPLNREQE